MKKIYGFAALAAAMTLASCSNENEPNNVPVGGEGSPAYMAVKIINDDMTRAEVGTDDGEFAYGTKPENTVETATFVLFNGNNKSQIVNLSPTEWKDDAADNQTSVASHNKDAKVLVINRAKDEPEIDGMVTILNAPETLKASLEGCSTLSDVQTLTADYTGNATTQSGKFVMTTAAYANASGVKVYKTDISGKVKTSVNEALKDAAEVYVDRVVAKVSLTNNLGNTGANEGATVTFADETTPTTVTIDVQGIMLANQTDKTAVLKNISFATDPSWNWNDLNNFRSYWAVTPATAGYKTNSSWEGLGTTKFDMGYINENTNSKVTSVVVTAQLKVGNDPLDLVVLLQGKKYYRKQDGIKFLVNTFTSSYCYKDGDTYKSLKDTQFDWVAAPAKGPEYAHLAYTDDKPLYKADANGKWVAMDSDDITAFNTLLASDPYTALKWTNGAAYYFVDIKNPSATEAGVVRNHVYNITLTDIKGLGIPVFDPKDWPIDPENPDPNFDEVTYYSLGAQINVLKWARVDQEMSFDNNNDKY